MKKKTKEWTVYMVETEKGSLYTGITTDFERRLNEHMTGKKGAKFFRTQKALKPRYLEKCKNRSLASKREAFIKSLTRKEKLRLIEENT